MKHLCSRDGPRPGIGNKYDAATDHLKELLDKKKQLQTEELMAAVLKSKHSYEDILRYINSETDDE